LPYDIVARVQKIFFAHFVKFIGNKKMLKKFSMFFLMAVGFVAAANAEQDLAKLKEVDWSTTNYVQVWLKVKAPHVKDLRDAWDSYQKGTSKHQPDLVLSVQSRRSLKFYNNKKGYSDLGPLSRASKECTNAYECTIWVRLLEDSSVVTVVDHDLYSGQMMAPFICKVSEASCTALKKNEDYSMEIIRYKVESL
jgi:hypothetical protein